MKQLNVILLFHPDGKQMLMCRRQRDPYKGKYNGVGGHVDPGETPLEAAYRELHEETGYTRSDVELHPVVTMLYHHTDIELQCFAGQLTAAKEAHGDENPLFWLPLSENYFDLNRFAGEGNIGHMLYEAARMPQFSFLRSHLGL